MAIPILVEKVGIFRFSAVTIGSLGALLDRAAGGLPLGWGVLYAILSATAYASLTSPLTRKCPVRIRPRPAWSMSHCRSGDDHGSVVCFLAADAAGDRR